MILMKCKKCGLDNKEEAKFCTRCGTPFSELEVSQSPVKGSDATKYAIIALVVVIIILVACVGYFAGVMSSNDSVESVADSTQNATSSNAVQSGDDSESDEAQTVSVSSSESKTAKVTESKSWESIGSYSGSGSGSQTIEVPDGEIMVKLSAYPIKNYADNHLYVSGDNGQSGGVEWGPHSDVETRSDSFTYSSSSSNVFTIDYYETVDWQVEFYRYQ